MRIPVFEVCGRLVESVPPSHLGSGSGLRHFVYVYDISLHRSTTHHVAPTRRKPSAGYRQASRCRPRNASSGMDERTAPGALRRITGTTAGTAADCASTAKMTWTYLGRAGRSRWLAKPLARHYGTTACSRSHGGGHPAGKKLKGCAGAAREDEAQLDRGGRCGPVRTR
jgi:hypothetical protein